MSKEKLYLPSGGNEVKLQSGDKGLYVDIDLESLQKLLEENEDVKREWVSKSGESGSYVRVFVLPKKTPRGKYTHYLELAYPKL